jgi:hypothetical protein
LHPQVQKSSIIFAGGVYVGKNSYRPASVRAKRVRAEGRKESQMKAQCSGFHLPVNAK